MVLHRFSIVIVRSSAHSGTYSSDVFSKVKYSINQIVLSIYS